MKNAFGKSAASALWKILAAGCLFFAAALAQAQSYGSIVGNVADATGAAVPQATVTITNLDTNDKRLERTNAGGTYRAVNLIPGRYRTDVELPGFKHFAREPIQVDVETAVRVDVVLTVGATSEVIEVNSQTPLLQTESATLQDVVDGKTVEEMPLNGKNVENLIALTPGVVAQGSTAGATGSNQSAGHTNLVGWNNYSIGGGIAGQSAQFLDGAPTTGLGGNLVFLVPNQDSIGEFRVASAAVSAEFGRFGGGVVNFTSKSGGNDLHGSAYEYFRNKALNASTYFGKRSGQPKAAFNQNQFGGTLGGHIVRDKLFFFGNYEQYKIISGSTFTGLVPTAAERTGDFSADLTSASNCTVAMPTAAQAAGCIYDPSTSVLTGNSAFPVTRTAFTGNKIASTSVDATGNVILNVLKYYPLPNTTGAGYNYAATVNPGVQSKQGGIRLDYNLSEKQRLFARYTRWNLSDIPLNQYANITGGAASHQFTHDFVFGDTYSFSSKLVGDLRFSYGRGYSDDSPQSLGYDISAFGPAYSALKSMVSATMLLGVGPAGYGSFQGLTNYDFSYRNTYALTPSVSYVIGQHALKAGADIRFMDYDYLSANGSAGSFNFTNSFTSANGLTLGGNAIASLLVGTPSSGTIATGAEIGQYSWYQGYYLTDTWQASRKVTVDAGIRYEIPGAFSERKDRATVLLPNAANPLGTVNGISTKGGLFLVNSGAWASRNTEQQKYDLFSPRLGVVYNPVANTVVRAGYSLTYLPMDAFDGAAPGNSPINSATTNMVVSNSTNPYLPTNRLSDPFPAGGVTGTLQQSVLQPVGRSQTYLNNLAGLSISGPVPFIRAPYAQQWTTSIQQQFPGETLLQIAYSGNRGTFLPEGINYLTGSANNINQLPDQYDSLGSALITPVANPYAGLLNQTGNLNGTTVAAGQLLRPFSEYSNVIQTNAKGDSIYHAMLVSLRKRLPGGGLVNTNYTWAKLLGNVSGSPFAFAETAKLTVGQLQDFTNPRGERSILNTDVRNRFVTSFVTPLPFGKGKRYLGNVGGVAGGFINGWETNAIVTFQTGFNLSVASQNNGLSSFGAGVIRPNVVAGCQKQVTGAAQARIGGWFNTGCFQSPNAYSFGNEPRVDGTLRAAGIANYDFSVSKDTGLSERLKLQLKAEVFNLFNRVQFAPPATVLGQAGFGAVTDTSNQPRQIQLSGRLLF